MCHGCLSHTVYDLWHACTCAAEICTFSALLLCQLSFFKAYLSCFHSSCVLVCQYSPSAKQVIFFCATALLQLCPYVCGFMRAFVHICMCVAQPFGRCVKIMGHHLMSMFLFIYGWLLSRSPTYPSLDLSFSKPIHAYSACLTPSIHL